MSCHLPAIIPYSNPGFIVYFPRLSQNVTIPARNREYSLKPKECIISFDVVSLFTNTPLDLAHETINEIAATDSLIGLLNHCLKLFPI